MPEVKNGHRDVTVIPPYRYPAVIMILFALMIAIPVLNADPPPPVPASPLPAPIKTLLDQEYPGWKFASSSKEVRLELEHHHANHPPSFLTADFDGNGQPDYAVQIVHGEVGKEEQNVIAFKIHDGVYEETVLESFAPNSSVYLWSTKQAFTAGVSGNGLYMKDHLVIMGGELGETSYEYEDGKFEEVNPAAEAN